jgi:hypothetical protein
MITTLPYDRARAVEYARRWALSRNPLFIDFTGRGGNCTSFISQCLLAGGAIMNYTPTYGWYYVSPEDRAPAWSGVNELYNFLTGIPEFSEANGGIGPFATEARNNRTVEIGDIIQLANSEGTFYHTLIISAFEDGEVLICANSDNALDRPLSSYNYSSLRVLHIEGIRAFYDNSENFNNLINGISLPEVVEL